MEDQLSSFSSETLDQKCFKKLVCFGRRCVHVNVIQECLVTPIIWFFVIDIIHKQLEGTIWYPYHHHTRAEECCSGILKRKPCSRSSSIKSAWSPPLPPPRVLWINCPIHKYDQISVRTDSLNALSNSNCPTDINFCQVENWGMCFTVRVPRILLSFALWGTANSQDPTGREFQRFLQHLQVRPVEPYGILAGSEIPSARILGYRPTDIKFWRVENWSALHG